MEAELADGFDLFTHNKFVLVCFLSLVKSDIIIIIIIMRPSNKLEATLKP